MLFHEFLSTKKVLSDTEISEVKEFEQKNDIVSISKIITKNNHYPQIFSNQKFLTTPPFNNIEYNRRGLHVFRVYFSNLAHQKKVTSDDYLNKGILKYNNFIGNQNILDNLIAETNNIPVRVNKGIENTISLLPQGNFKACLSTYFKMAPIILNMIGREEDDDAKSKFATNTFVQKIINSPEDNDIQKVAHSDIFFPAIKWWYFPKEIKTGEGAFMYAPNSVQLTEKLLDFYYNESIKISKNNYEEWRGDGHREGSFRFSEEEIKSFGWELEEQTVEPDTLVVGNVFGIHSRGFTNKICERVSIHGSIRVNDPFN